MSEIRARKQIGIDLDEGPENGFGHDFGAHRSVQEEIQIVRRPFRNLRGIDANGFFLLVGRGNRGSS